MILFCEDCGKRNTIGNDQINGIMAHFKCLSCGYLNHISINRVSANVSADIDCLAQQKDVIGFFLFHVQNGVLIRNMPAPLIDSDLIVLGKLLTSAYKTSQETLLDLTCLTLVISGKNMIIRMDQTHTIALIAACKDFPLSNDLETILNSIDISSAAIKRIP